MKKNREELEKMLYVSIQESLPERRKIKEKIISQLAENRISAGTASSIYSTTIPFATLSPAELYLFTKALYAANLDYKINPTEWFNEEEIKTYDSFKAEEFYKNDVVVFTGVDQNSEDQFCVSKVFYKEISNMFHQALISYNIRTQRQTTSVKFNNVTTEIPTIKQKNVSEITQKMLKNKFKANMITFNIRKTGKEIFEYDAKDRTLSVGIDNENESFMDVIDGMHRLLAMTRVIESSPQHNGYTMINIVNYTEEDAQEFIHQEALHAPIDKTHLAAFKNDDNGVMIAKYINKYGNEKNNEMFNQFATNENELKSPHWKYTTIEIFAKAFNINFKIETPREFTKIQNYLIEFFNETIGILKENKVFQDKGMTNHIFVGYVALASKLYGKDDWKTVLENTLKDFNFDDPNLSNLGVYSNKISQSNIKKLSDYFKKLGVS